MKRTKEEEVQIPSTDQAVQSNTDALLKEIAEQLCSCRRVPMANVSLYDFSGLDMQRVASRLREKGWVVWLLRPNKRTPNPTPLDMMYSAHILVAHPNMDIEEVGLERFMDTHHMVQPESWPIFNPSEEDLQALAESMVDEVRSRALPFNTTEAKIVGLRVNVGGEWQDFRLNTPVHVMHAEGVADDRDRVD